MREMRRRMQIMYSRFFISFKPPFCLKIGGRHSINVPKINIAQKTSFD